MKYFDETKTQNYEKFFKKRKNIVVFLHKKCIKATFIIDTIGVMW